MIPKTIHYMWFGKNPLPESTKKYIESWKKFCPDYEIKEWNESNFNIHCCKYVEEAYYEKKWAFVVDYVRFYILYHEGGIYVETDTEIIRSIDILRTHKAFFGRAGEDMTLPIIGLEKGSLVGKDMMEIYENSSFYLESGELNYKTVNQNLFELLRDKYGLDPNEKKEIQILKDDVSVFPEKYFYATDWRTGIITLNPDLFVIHHADGSWLSDKDALQVKLIKKYVKFFGKKGIYIAQFIFLIKTQGFTVAFSKFVNFLNKNRK